MKILVAESESFSAEAFNILRSIGEVELCDLNRKQLLQRIADFDVLWVRLRSYIDDEVLSKAKNLRFIVTPTTGLNHIDMAAAERRNIQVLCLKRHVDFLKEIRATAEHTVALMLALIRNIPSAVDDVKAGNWNRDLHKGTELFKKTVGIVGYGRVGQIVARYLRAFDTKILVTDPYRNSADYPSVEFVSLPELLTLSDLVSIHVNLTPETENLFGIDEFKQMRLGAKLINTSRGEVVDESALLSCLVDGLVSGAALDVLSSEVSIRPLDNPLVQFAKNDCRLLITPHLAGCTKESMEKTEVFMARQLQLCTERRA